MYFQASLLGFVHSANVPGHISMAHLWLHHQMTTDQLAHHFGTFDAKKVDPNTYQVCSPQALLWSSLLRQLTSHGLHISLVWLSALAQHCQFMC